VDEMLKQKQDHLRTLREVFPGSTPIFRKMIYDHESVVFNMRNYLQIFCKFHFLHNLSAPEDISELMKSFQENESFKQEIKINISDLQNSELWCLINATSDFNNTKDFYKKLLTTFFKGSDLEMKPEVVDMIVKSVDFRVFLSS